MMELPIVFVLVEMLRAGCGGGWGQVQAWQQAQAEAMARAEQQRLEEIREALEEVPAVDERLHDPSQVRVLVGGMRMPDLFGLDPGAAPAGPGSILSTDDSDLQPWFNSLQSAGVGVAPGATYGPDSGASPTGGGGGGLVPGPARYKLREYMLFPPTPYVEPFTLLIPSPLPPADQPLLVVFHKFGSSHLDVLQNTDYIAQCARRGWFMVCPFSAAKKHFGSIEGQINTQAVLDWVLAHPSLRIDVKRIYGVGFSMGGGAALNFAARHRDPAHAMFAALIDHSGGTSLNNTYANDPPARFIMDFWYGDGSAGSADPWKLSRSSVLDFDPLTLVGDTSTNLARNLAATPVQILRASSDPITYVAEQCDALDRHFTLDLGRQPGTSYSYTVVPYTGHSWSMLDASAACDWLGQFTLQVPTTGRTLADVDAVYEHFYVEQDAGGAFTPFDWNLSAANNELQVSASANLKRLTLDPLSAGLSTTTALRVRLQTSDGSGDEIVLAHWPQSPSSVQRDGFATVNWSYSPQSLELTLLETDGALHDWLIQP